MDVLPTHQMLGATGFSKITMSCAVPVATLLETI